MPSSSAPVLAVGMLGLLAVAASRPALAAGAGREVLDLAHMPPAETLAELVWQRAPELQATRARLAAARGDLDRSRLLPNPTADLGAIGLAVGQTNPSGLDRWAQTPSYTIQLSELIEIGKRGPRQESARESLRAAALAACDDLRQRWFDLQEHIAEIAAAELRIAAVTALAADTAELTRLERARADKGAAAGLDAERAALEEAKYLATLTQERARLDGELLACGRIAGLTCLPFGSPEAARGYLDLPVGSPLAALETRPDLAALQAQAAAAAARRRLAERRKIPDPTLRAGYTHDQLTVAGNQPNALLVGVSIPLPIFDRGQADAREAAALQEAAVAQRELLLDQAGRDLGRLGELERRLAVEQRRMSSETVPAAHRLVDRLDEVVRRGGASVYELLLARRTLGELVVNSIEVEAGLHRVRIDRARVAGSAPPPPFATDR